MSAKTIPPLFRLLGTASLFLGVSAFTQANVIFSNDFESVPTGSYATGEAFGVDPILGNNSLNSANVGATNGVNGSRGITRSDVLVRSQTTYDMTTLTNFRAFGYFGALAQTTNGFLGAGWGRASSGETGTANETGIDGGNIYSRGANNRFEVGLRLTGAGDETAREVRLATGGAFGGFTNLSGEAGDVLVADLPFDHWYELNFDLTFQHDADTPTASNFLIQNLVLRDWGADGVTGGAIVLSLDEAVVNGSYAHNFDNDPFGYAIVAGNRDRGLKVIDNITVTMIPEPGVGALGLLGLAAVLFVRRRRNGSLVNA